MLTISRQNQNLRISLYSTARLAADHHPIRTYGTPLSRPTIPKMANIQNPTAPQLSEEDKKNQTWGQYGKQVYNEQYERWMPWIEDFYLRWFTRDNKTSYATKG